MIHTLRSSTANRLRQLGVEGGITLLNPVKQLPGGKKSELIRRLQAKIAADAHDVSDEARDDHGRWTDGGNSGQREADTKKFYTLKAHLAEINNDLLQYMDTPTKPEVQAKMDEMKSVVKQISQLDIDPGGFTEGIGLPGGPKDIVIVGAGPGGMASAIMGVADGLETTVVEGNKEVGGQAKYSTRIENYPGFPVGVPGAKLAASMKDQAERLGTDFKLGTRVTGMTYDPATGMKSLTLSTGEKLTARAVILAGGVEFRQMDFPGSQSEDVIYGNSQMLKDKYANKPVVVIGGSNGAAQAALGAALTAQKVYLLSKSPLEKSMSDYQIQAVSHHPKIEIVTGDNIAKAFLDEHGRVNGIETQKGKKLDARGIGIFIGSAPKTEWLPPEITREEGKIRTNDDLETAVPGVFAIGDIRVGSIGRVGAAVGDGQMATKNVFSYFARHKAAHKTKVAAAADGKRKGSPVARLKLLKIIDDLFALDRKYPQPMYDSVERSRKVSANSLLSDIQLMRREVEALGHDVSDEARDDHGRWTDTGGAIFVSPNVKENLSFDEAGKGLTSDRQRQIRQMAKNLLEANTKNYRIADVIGDWSDGAENSLFIQTNIHDPEKVAYLASKMGQAAQQKAVIAFSWAKGGKDSVWGISVKGNNLNRIRSVLDSNGVQFRSLERHGGDTLVHVFDEGTQLQGKIQDAAYALGGKVSVARGGGEFIGGETRNEGLQRYRERIDRFNGRQKTGIGAGRSNRGYHRSVTGGGNEVRHHAGAEKIQPKRIKEINALAHDVSDEARDDHGRWTGSDTNTGRSDTVVLSFGRFNPPHRGHTLLTDKLVSTAKEMHADPVLFVNEKQGPKDPLHVKDKIRYLKEMAPGLQIVSRPKSDVPDPEDIVKLYSNKGYKHLVIVEGGDRAEWFHNLIDHRMKSGEYKFKDWKFVNAGDRGSEGAWSATQQREAAVKGDYNAFRSGLPKAFPEHMAKEMYGKVRGGLGITGTADDAEETWPPGWGDGVDASASLLTEIRLMRRIAERELNALAHDVSGEPRDDHGRWTSGAYDYVAHPGWKGVGRDEFRRNLAEIQHSAIPLTPEQQKVEDRARALFARYPEELKAEYRRVKGNELNADDAKELSPDYQRDRTDNAVPVHESASWLMKQLWPEYLKAPLEQGKEKSVIFTAGAAGAGKTSAIKSNPDVEATKEKAAIVFDGVLRPADKAIKRIGEALDKGYQVHVAFIHQDPIFGFRTGILRRAAGGGQGRTVPMDEYIKQVLSVQDAMKAVKDRFGALDSFHMSVFDNRYGHGHARKTELANLPDMTKEWTAPQLKTVLTKELNDSLAAHEITPKIYKAVLAKGAGKEVGI